MTLVYLSLSWLTGILLGAKFALPPLTLLSGLAPLILLIRWRHRRRPVILASLCLTLFIGGTLYFQVTRPATDEHSLQFYNDLGTVTAEGVISRPPETGDRTAQVRLDISVIINDTGHHEVSGTALLFLPKYPTYEYGNRLRVTGELQTPVQLEDFDYRCYLAAQEIYATMLYPQTELLEKGTGNLLLAGVYSFRDNLAGSLARTLAEPQASLTQALLIGMRDNIPDDVRGDFNQSGAAHLLAISGLHLTILTGILLSLGIWLFGRRHYTYIWLTLGVVWLYTLLTGLQPPIIRAAIMVSLFLAADLFGRQRHAFTALAFTAALMVSFNPQLLWQASFQMSFAAMAGLVFVTPVIQSGADTLANGTTHGLLNTVTGSFSATLGAVIAVWPLIAYYFGTVSLVAPLTTLFSLPVLPAAIVTGLLAALTGLVWVPLAQGIAWLTWLCLSYILLVVNVFSSLSLAYIKINTLSPGFIAGYYLALAVTLCLVNRRPTMISELWQRLKSGSSRTAGRLAGWPSKYVILPLFLLAVLSASAASTMPDDRLHVSFLDVGQGDAILITHGSQQVLIDGGPDPQALEIALGERMPFWDRTIELVVLTHPHADHLTGLLDVLARYRVEQVLYPNLEYESSLYDEWLRVIPASGAETTLAQAGQHLELGNGIIIDVLNPQPSLFTDADNNSVVLHLTSGEISFLLTGDIYQETELELIRQRAAPASTVLKVAHHGSDTSTSPEFLESVDPQITVISVGQGNPHGHPSQAVIERLTTRLGSDNIYRTDEDGTIEFITDGQRLWVKTSR